MNNDNEIMKEFNEKFGNRQESNVEPYRAKQNQNVVDINYVNNSNNFVNTNYSGSNIQSSSVNVVPEINNSDNSFSNSYSNIGQSNGFQQLYDTSGYINDSDRPVEIKQKKATIKINPELKTAIVLVLILLIAMFFVPMIFDFIDDLRIKISG